VAERGQSLADFVLAREVEVGGDEALRIRGLGEHDAPGVDDHRPSVAVEVRGRETDLARRDHEDLVLDRAGADEDLPVITPGALGERGGDGDHPRAP
jgi:hypothetical protein